MAARFAHRSIKTTALRSAEPEARALSHPGRGSAASTRVRFPAAPLLNRSLPGGTGNPAELSSEQEEE